MASNIVTISGMFGNGKTYFADSPVVIDISGLEWSKEGQPVTSPFTIVRVEVIYDSKVVGEFKADTGGQTSISFDISSALRAIWSDFDYSKEVAAAKSAATSAGSTAFAPSGDGYQNGVRRYREYFLRVYTEYLASDDGGVFTVTQYTDEEGNADIPGGQCCIGGMTEWERSTIPSKEAADVSYREHENQRNGDASVKPTDTPERVGSMSITSWVDVQQGGTQCVYYPVNATPAADQQEPHAPFVLRDSVPYVDFLFLNRRGAVETCSGQTLESMGINVKVTQYSRTERPSFNPVRSLMAIGQDGRRAWQMSSGYVTREWAEWWAMEFLGGKRKQWWMRYPIGDANGTYVPVIVEPAKQNTSIYDRSKQQMPHVDFTVTLALEG
jgi:hypothetical protein